MKPITFLLASGDSVVYLCKTTFQAYGDTYLLLCYWAKE